MVLEAEISLLVPTKNRPGFLERTLSYYAEREFTGKILILDSSTDARLEKNRLLIRRLTSYLDINYEVDPALSEVAALYTLIQKTDTKFVVELHDDNFLVPEGLIACMEFLERNRDYSACRGAGLTIKTHESDVYGPLTKCAVKRQPASDLDSAGARYLSFLSDYSDVCFTVHRTEVYRHVLKYAYLDDWYFFKILSSSYTFIAGKVKALEDLVLVRHIQDRPYRAPEALSITTWLSKEAWRKEYFVLEEFIVSGLLANDSLNKEEGIRLFQQGFVNFLTDEFKGKFYTPLVDPAPRLKHVGVRNLVDVVRKSSVFFSMLKCRIAGQDFVTCEKIAKTGHFLLGELLRPGSRHYGSFVDIYHCVTQSDQTRRIQKQLDSRGQGG